MTEAVADAELMSEAAIIVAREGWHAGVAGIVAAKLVERFGKPAAVIALDAAKGEGRGSLRTTGGFNLFRALTACKDHLDPLRRPRAGGRAHHRPRARRAAARAVPRARRRAPGARVGCVDGRAGPARRSGREARGRGAPHVPLRHRERRAGDRRAARAGARAAASARTARTSS